MLKIKPLLILIISLFYINTSHSCDGLTSTIVSNSYIGNGEYLIKVEVCEIISNTEMDNGVVSEWAKIYGIILTVNGANIISVNTASISGISSGVTLTPNITGNQVEYGDWGNTSGSSPILLDYGDPIECWTFEIIVDAPSITLDILSSSNTNGAVPIGTGMTYNNGSWGCGNTVGVPFPTCNANWTPPTFCLNSTTPIDLNTTTSTTGVFTGLGVDSSTGIFNPTGLTSNITVTLAINEPLFNCSSTQDIVIINLDPPTLNDTTICPNDSATLDATITVASGCLYSVVLGDGLGSGWNGADLDIYINGVLYLLDQTVLNCGSTSCQDTLTIPVNTGDIILLNYSSGTPGSQNSIYLYDALGVLVSGTDHPPVGNLGTGTIASCADAVIDYSWTPTTGLSDPNIANPIASPGVTTTYTVEISSPTLPCTTQTQVTVTVIPCLGCIPPDLIVNDITICAPNTVDLNNSIDPASDPGNISFHSNQTDAGAGVNNINSIVNVSGIYYVRIEDISNPICDSVLPVNVTINPIYSKIIPINICTGSDYTFSDGVTHSNIIVNETYDVMYSSINGCDSIITTDITVNPIYNDTFAISICLGDDYTFPDGVTHSNIIIDETYNALALSINGCDSNVTTNITVNPIYTDTLPINICSGDDYTFLDGVTHSNITINETYDVMYSSINGCDSTVTTNITVNPIYIDTLPVNICSGDNYTFLDGVTHSNILIDESYDVIYSSINGCDSIITTDITVHPVYTNTVPVNICSGDNYTFSDGVIHSNILIDETYDVMYSSINGCDSTVTTNITVNPIYIDTLPVNICSGDDYTFPDGTIHTNIISDETYTVILLSINGCDSTITTNIFVYPIYTETIPVSICYGDNYTFLDGVTHSNIVINETYDANFLSINGCDSIITTNVTVNPIYSSLIPVNICSGENYTFLDGVTHSNILIDESYDIIYSSINGCDSIITTTITINNPPQIDAGNDQVICTGTSIILSAYNSSGASISWNNGITDGVSFTPTTSSTYTVTAINSIGCINTDSVIISISTFPIVNFNGDTLQGCVPHTVLFTNLTTTTNNNSCFWDFGDGQTSTNCAPQHHTYNSAGLYTISLTVTNADGCSTTTSYTDYVNVIPHPIASFTASSHTINQYETEISFINTSINTVNYNWNFGDGTDNSIIENPIHQYPEIISNYYVTLTVENHLGCIDSASIYINYSQDLIYYIPNTFTPDGDEYNNIFFPIFSSGYDPYSYHLIIFNRWGQIIFESYDTDFGWDGTYKGRIVQNGTYTWKIDFKEIMTDKKHTVNGHVNILR